MQRWLCEENNLAYNENRENTMNKTLSLPLHAIRKNTGSFIALPVLALFLLLQSGCAVKQPVPQPRYPQKTTGRTAPSTAIKSRLPSSTYPSPQKMTPAPEPPVATYTPKVGPGGALYSSAKDAIGQGNYQQAEMALERALKIEPRNAHYWYTMAQVKYKQKQYSQTIQLCSKSKSLAGKNAQLLQLNEELSEKAQQRLTRY